ncbi:hypothetical protein M758_1G156200 [Ceratodon purpureus]|nr:hypothetical protein M758_1G156200 [Ceratodon purpureus]
MLVRWVLLPLQPSISLGCALDILAGHLVEPGARRMRTLKAERRYFAFISHRRDWILCQGAGSNFEVDRKFNGKETGGTGTYFRHSSVHCCGFFLRWSSNLRGHVGGHQAQVDESCNLLCGEMLIFRLLTFESMNRRLIL